MTDKIFIYSKDTGFTNGLRKIEVYDRDEESVKALVLTSDAPDTATYNLDKETREKLKETIASYDQLFEEDIYETEDNYDLNSKITNLDLYSGNKKVEISTLNLKHLNDPKFEKAYYLIGLMGKLREILIEAGVEEKYFSL